MHETKFIILNSLESSVYHFHCYSMIFLPLYLSFHLHSLHRHPDSPHFLHFHPDSRHCHANSLDSHFHPIFHSYSPHFPPSDIQLPGHFVFFKNLFQENICFSSKTKTPLFNYYITPGTKLLFTSSMTLSVLSPKIIYLMVSQVKNLESVKCQQKF